MNELPSEDVADVAKDVLVAILLVIGIALVYHLLGLETP